MSWLSELLLGYDSRLTFDQELELLVVRWQDRSRKQGHVMTPKEIGTKLLDKAEALLDGKP